MNKSHETRKDKEYSGATDAHGQPMRPGESSEDSSPASILTLSSESWETVEKENDDSGVKGVVEPNCSQDLPKETQTFNNCDNTKPANISTHEIATKESNIPDDTKEKNFFENDKVTCNLEDESVPEELGSSRKTASFQPKICPEAVFDGQQTTLYCAHDRADNNTALFGNKVIRPIQQLFQRKAVVNEKSPLVKNELSLANDVILPQVPIPDSNGHDEKYSDLPEGIGTGRSDSEMTQNNADEEKQEKSNVTSHTYSDAAIGLSLAFIGAGVMYGATAVLVRLAGENGVGSVQVLFMRSVFQSLLFGSILLCKRVGVRPPPGRMLRCIFIAILYSMATFASYEAFNLIPPGSAIATRGACRTIFSLILAYIITREKVGLADLVTVLMCVGGIAMIITSGMTSGEKDYILPPGMTDNPKLVRVYGFSLIVVGGICRSLGLVAVRGAREDLSAFTVVFYHSSLTVLVAAILLAAVRQPSWPPSWTGVAYAAGVCVAASIATWSSNQAVKYVHPALVSLGQNADVVVSITLQHTILQIPPKALELGGVALIFIGVTGLTVTKWWKSRKTEEQSQAK